MATAKELVDRGDLAGALETLIQEVKASPADTTRRTFLFELLCFAGEWDRAEKQLEVIGHQSTKAEIGVQAYHQNIAGERARRRVFSTGEHPQFITSATDEVSLQLMALAKLKENDVAGAREALNQAEEQRPALAGSIDGTPFEDFRDADDRVGSVLEIFMQERYVWLPFAHIKRLEIAPPAQLRDLLWARIRIETVSGLNGEAFVPVVYAGSESHSDDRVKLGRVTEWKDIGNDLVVPAGMRLFLVDGEDRGLFESKVIKFGETREE
jgi:type VI secretion system protein ImpE